MPGAGVQIGCYKTMSDAQEVVEASAPVRGAVLAKMEAGILTMSQVRKKWLQARWNLRVGDVVIVG